MSYNASYFIKKFEAIPKKDWICGAYHNKYNTKHCALGFCTTCDITTKEHELNALVNLFSKIGLVVVDVNDDFPSQPYKQSTPKERILAALYDIKVQEAVEEAEAIIQNPVEVLEV